MMKRSLIMMVMVSASLLTTRASQADELWRAAGFKTPESVLYDQGHDQLIVSNMNGAPTDVDGNGYLSILSLEGKIVTQKWATGLDAPKGMAIFGDRLYVADITKLRVVDLNTGEVIETVPFDGSVFLNDVTASPAGEIYITDMMTNAIYRYHEGKGKLWLKDEGLNMPNGILVEDDHLIVGSWGKGIKKDFTTEIPGGLLSIDIASKAITPIPQAERFGNIDGIVKANGSLIVSDYIAGVLWRSSAGKAPEKIATLKPGSADIGTDGKTLFVPMMNEGEVAALPVR